MPEGHTVHRLARTLRDLFEGEALRVTSPQGRFADGAALLTGRRLAVVEAWGKQLFCGFLPDDDAAADVVWLRTHLGLYGAWTFAGAPGAAEVAHAIGAPRKRVGERETFPAPGPGRDSALAAGSTIPPEGDGGAATSPDEGRWEPPAPRGQVRARLLGRHAVADLTGPAACEVITSDEKDAVTARLGPDPIRDGEPGHDAAPFVAKVGRSRTTIGQLLMDQAVIAGVGNIYRAEALFRAGVDPLKPGRDVPPSSVNAIWDDLVVLMRDGARTGAIVTTRPEHRDGVSAADAPADPAARRDGTGDAPSARSAAAPGGPRRTPSDKQSRPLPDRRRTRQNTDGQPDAVPSDQAFYVYHRDGLPCRRCATPVLTKELAGRNLFWCPTCQH